MKLDIRKGKLYTLFFVGLAVISCDKKDNIATGNFDNNRINMVIADNFNLSLLSTVLRVSTLDQELKGQEGPFTILAPSDNAFEIANYSSKADILGENPSVISRIAKYHLLDGKYELNKLPFLFNQELRTRGGKVYATHWVKGADTVLTLNGARVLSYNLPASNGLIQVLDRVLTPYMHDFIADAIAADADITLFAQALQKSGVLASIGDKGPYTIFAPSNEAMQEFGYRTVQEIESTSPAVLKQFVSYHIIKDRRFVYDYILTAGPSNSAKQGMMDGNSITVNLIAGAGNTFSGISLRGIGNTSDVGLKKQDVLSGNGVLHVVDKVLRITQ